jgi:hypothetical protein
MAMRESTNAEGVMAFCIICGKPCMISSLSWTTACKRDSKDFSLPL